MLGGGEGARGAGGSQAHGLGGSPPGLRDAASNPEGAGVPLACHLVEGMDEAVGRGARGTLSPGVYAAGSLSPSGYSCPLERDPQGSFSQWSCCSSPQVPPQAVCRAKAGSSHTTDQSTSGFTTSHFPSGSPERWEVKLGKHRGAVENPICTTPGSTGQHLEQPGFKSTEHSQWWPPWEPWQEQGGLCTSMDHVSLP